MPEVIETSAEPVANAAALVPLPNQAIVRPAASIDDVLAVSAAYHDLYTRLLDNSDFQPIGQKKFPKKSAWRKLALAFNVSTKIIERDYERDAGRIIRAEVVVRAEATNGRVADGLGAADLFEKCCSPGCRTRHYHCPAAEGNACEGSRHWSHPQHDIPATAATRAGNRACSDLFGMGEVSAEEVDANRDEVGEATPAYDAMAHLEPYLLQLNQQELAQLAEWRKAVNADAGELVLDTPARMTEAMVERTLVQIGQLVERSKQRQVHTLVEAETERAAPRAGEPVEEPRAAGPAEAAEDDSRLFNETSPAEFDLEGVDPNEDTRTWAEQDFDERTDPKGPWATTSGTPTAPSGTSEPAPATSDEPLNLVQRGHAIHFHRRAGGIGVDKATQEAIVVVASRGRTNHAAKLTVEEMTVAETLLEQLRLGHQQPDAIVKAAQEYLKDQS